MNSAPQIESLILDIEDIRESANVFHHSVIDSILAKARETHHIVITNDLTALERDLTITKAADKLNTALFAKSNKLTGRG